jgi:hypothetical protein
MKEVQVIAWCDGTQHEGDRVPAEFVDVPVMIDGEEVSSDLCALCSNYYLGRARELLGLGERKTKRKRKQVRPNHNRNVDGLARFAGTVGDYECQWVDPDSHEVCPFKSTSTQGLGRHRTVQSHPKRVDQAA